MVTIQDVAKHASVSVGTVSRVLNEHPSVRPAVRTAVLGSISELGYRPNSIARDLRRTRTRTLGLMVNDLTNPASVSLLRGAEDAARDAGYAVIITESRSDPETERLNLRTLLERRVDGVLCVPVHSVRALAEQAEQANVPIAVLNQRNPNRRVPSAYIEETPATAAALECLLQLGHQKLAMIHIAGVPAARARSEYVRQYLAERSVPSPGLWTFSRMSECEPLVTKLLDALGRPTALIVGAHQYLPEVLSAVRNAGLRVPADVSIVSFGDSRWAEAMSPSISVIAADQRQHAMDTTEMLLRILDGDESAPRTVSSTSTFIQRESCGPPPRMATE